MDNFGEYFTTTGGAVEGMDYLYIAVVIVVLLVVLYFAGVLVLPVSESSSVDSKPVAVKQGESMSVNTSMSEEECMAAIPATQYGPLIGVNRPVRSDNFNGGGVASQVIEYPTATPTAWSEGFDPSDAENCIKYNRCSVQSFQGGRPQSMFEGFNGGGCGGPYTGGDDLALAMDA